MARRNPRGLELSFHPTRKRWYKGGKQSPSGRMEFGPGMGVGDRESYRAARARARAPHGATRRPTVPCPAYSTARVK